MFEGEALGREVRREGWEAGEIGKCFHTWNMGFPPEKGDGGVAILKLSSAGTVTRLAVRWHDLPPGRFSGSKRISSNQ